MDERYCVSEPPLIIYLSLLLVVHISRPLRVCMRACIRASECVTFARLGACMYALLRLAVRQNGRTTGVGPRSPPILSAIVAPDLHEPEAQEGAGPVLQQDDAASAAQAAHVPQPAAEDGGLAV